MTFIIIDQNKPRSWFVMKAEGSPNICWQSAYLYISKRDVGVQKIQY